MLLNSDWSVSRHLLCQHHSLTLSTKVTLTYIVEEQTCLWRGSYFTTNLLLIGFFFFFMYRVLYLCCWTCICEWLLLVHAVWTTCFWPVTVSLPWWKHSISMTKRTNCIVSMPFAHLRKSQCQQSSSRQSSQIVVDAELCNKTTDNMDLTLVYFLKAYNVHV